jgi:peptidoglycan/LPS O-acetylase OafA/YrhL
MTSRFSAIEGLRGWLAWSVVLTHCIVATGIGGVMVKIGDMGNTAVFVFIIISGFVITHMMIERPEPYAPYITRRFMRIFPLFGVACIAGVFTLQLWPETLSRMPWVIAGPAEGMAAVVQSQRDHFWAHVVVHLTMLHGAINNNWLPQSSVAFAPPAWSLSLEWQYYLIAPFVFLAAKRAIPTLWLLAGCSVGALLFFRNGFGPFPWLLPSFLPGAAPYFMLGIITRIWWPSIKAANRFPTALSLTALAIAPLCSVFTLPIVAWAMLFSLQCVPDGLRGYDRQLLQIHRLLVESKIALYWGARSYAVYLIHMPVLCIAMYWFADPTISQWQFLFSILPATIIATAISASLAHKWIERPGIRLGTNMAILMQSFGYATNPNTSQGLYVQAPFRALKISRKTSAARRYFRHLRTARLTSKRM